VGGPDTVIVGALMTIVAGVIAVAGTALAGARPGRAALLMIVAVLLAGSVAPGVIPALAGTAVIFMAYLAGLGLLLLGAIVAFRERKTAPTAALAGLHA
jgi:hypothetical protein